MLTRRLHGKEGSRRRDCEGSAPRTCGCRNFPLIAGRSASFGQGRGLHTWAKGVEPAAHGGGEARPAQISHSE